MPLPNVTRFLSNAAGTSEFDLARRILMLQVTEQARATAFLYNSPFIFTDDISGQMSTSADFLMQADLDSPEDYKSGRYKAGQKLSFERGTMTLDNLLNVSLTLGMEDTRIAGGLLPAAARASRALTPRIVRELDRRAFVTAFLTGRAASATKNGQVVHTGGSRLKRSGGTSGNSTTSEQVAYPRTFAGAQRVRSDLRVMRENLVNKNIDVSAPIPLMTTPWIESVLREDNGIQVGTASNTVISGGSTLFGADYQSANSLHAPQAVRMLEGFMLIGTPTKTTGVNGGVWPWGNQTAINADTPSKYVTNFSPTTTDGNGQPVMIAFPRTGDGQYGIGCLKAMGITTNAELNEARTSTDFYEAMAWCGYDQMHPWAIATFEVYNAADGTVSVA